MVFANLFMFAAAQASSAPPPAANAEVYDEIIVIGRRARMVRWDWRVSKAGKLSKCKVTRSSGDAEIDQIGCETTRRCAAQGIRREKPMKACVIPVRQKLIEELADARAEERIRRLEDAKN